MQYRTLGRSGLKVSVAGLGCNNFGRRLDRAGTQAVLHAALDEGVNFLDTADMYGAIESETMIGELLKEQRQDLVIATKFAGALREGPLQGGASRRYIHQAVEASLDRLQTDYIDLYQVHFPDADTPAEETLEALNELVRQGKVRYLGCSNYAGWQIADAAWIARSRNLNGFVSAQNQYSLLDRRVEREVLPACEAFGLGLLPYFPLASGMLTGKYERDQPLPEGARLSVMGERGRRLLSEGNFDIVERLGAWAERRGRTLLETALGWLASQPGIPSVIAGATSAEQVRHNVAACGWELSDEELSEVADLSRQ